MISMLLRYCFTVSCQIFQEPKYAVRLGKYFCETELSWQLTGIIRHFLHRTTTKTEDLYIPDCHNFIPFLGNYVYGSDKSGMHKEAFEFHRKARTLKLNILLLFKIRSIFMRFWVFKRKMPQTVLILYSLWHYATYYIVFVIAVRHYLHSYTLNRFRLIYIQAFATLLT